MKLLMNILTWIISNIIYPIIKEALRLSAIVLLKATIILLKATLDILVMTIQVVVIGTLSKTVKVLV